MSKRKKYNLTLQEATKKALEIADKIYFGELPWPWDEWYRIADNWELNLWEEDQPDGTYKPRAALYPVKNNDPDTLDARPITLPSYITKENKP